MDKLGVRFVYHTGIRHRLFTNVRLKGSWGDAGDPENWSTAPMEEFVGDDGCLSYQVIALFPWERNGDQFAWGVEVDGPSGKDRWAIPTEVHDTVNHRQHRYFRLQQRALPEEYWLNTSRLLGANPYYAEGGGPPALRFAVWAPSAARVEVVFGHPEIGYISNGGNGIAGAPVPMSRRASDGLWTTDPSSPVLARFTDFDHRPYMYRITMASGHVAYRTDIYSRCQIGRGAFDPVLVSCGSRFTGPAEILNGVVSCSVVVDPDTVTARFESAGDLDAERISVEDFWKDEFRAESPLPTRLEDLVIYELHVAALVPGGGQCPDLSKPGTLADAIAMLDYLTDLGVNAIELLPLAEFEGSQGWGYGSSHFFAIEYSGGGRDEFKYFVRECHRRGMVVLMDVVYNHYTGNAERAQWLYDTDNHQDNCYYWYEGLSSNYSNPLKGYLANGSTGAAPRYHEERVRQMFVSSAITLATEFHVDGFRVDLTNAIHRDNVLELDNSSIGSANAFGGKLLRELNHALKLVKPQFFCIAEDHSEWEDMMKPRELGGVGFQADWYSEFYHDLIGDTQEHSANLVATAGYGDNRPLAIDRFAEKLKQTPNAKVVYPESHDEAGNSNQRRSGRTLNVAVNNAPLIGETRRWAEARSRFAAGMAMLSGGTPMFFMGEECGVIQPYRHDDFWRYRTDIKELAANDGQHLFRFFSDLIALRRKEGALRERQIDVIHCHNENRVLAFLRKHGDQCFLVAASLNNNPFNNGYWIDGVPDGEYREVFNSDAAVFGGWNDGNAGGVRSSRGGRIDVVIPRSGFVVFKRL